MLGGSLVVAILMSTYNGAAYIRQQLDSILAQTMADFTLYIRDDGSSDDTLAILHTYADPRIRLTEGENVGPTRSFFLLMEQAREADYLFFSDQDDVWHRDKLERMLVHIQPYDGVPAMVFSDFAMLDADGNTTDSSFARHASLRVQPGEVCVNRLLAQPYVFGCASVINRALAEVTAYVPDEIEMYDCWISLTAASVGKLIFVTEQTIGHRFHSANATGKAGQDSTAQRLKRVTRGFRKQADNSALRLHQVNLLLDCYGERILPEAKEMLTELSKSMAIGRTATVRALHKWGVKRQKRCNTLFFYLTVLGIRGSLA